MTHYLRKLLVALFTIATFSACGGEDAPKTREKDYLDGKTFESVFQEADEYGKREITFSIAFAHPNFTFSVEQKLSSISDDNGGLDIIGHDKHTMVGQYEYAQGVITFKNRSGIEEDFVKQTKRPLSVEEIQQTDEIRLIVSEQANTITILDDRNQAILLNLKK